MNDRNTTNQFPAGSLTDAHPMGGSSSSSSSHQNPNFDSNVISERVKNLATQIYQELKQIISRCNYDEHILSGLMPLIVKVLESLDLAIIENQQLQVELELCKDDNDQLVAMFEKEKASKRAIDKKLIESEYAYEEERQQYQQKIESLDSMVKVFELKAKNAVDQVSRFEEKEAERKKEYNQLHHRYSDLLKSHCDVVERVRHLVGNSEAANLTSINVPHQMVVSSSDLLVGDLQAAHQASRSKSKPEDLEKPSTLSGARSRDHLKSWTADTELTLEDASLVVIDDMLESHSSKQGDQSSQLESDRAATSETEVEHEKESENDSIAYTSMEKEFRKLIQENKDLLNTKNALNVVKDDLIAEVDRLSNEVSMYEKDVEQLNGAKDQMKQKVSALDAELRKTREELEKAKQKIRENNEEGVPYSQKKRFGRTDMAKVLMERNNYKERLMELQDALRYTELVRANKVETEKRSGLWKFFSNLFGATTPLGTGQLAITGPPTIGSRNSSPIVGANSAGVTPDLIGSDGPARGAIRSTAPRLASNSDLIVLMDSDLNVDRSRSFRAAGDSGGLTVGGAGNGTGNGYIHAYGWSLPASSVKALTSTEQVASRVASVLGGATSQLGRGDPLGGLLGGGSLDGSLKSRLGFGGRRLPGGLQVPIPQHCRPLTGDSLGMKIWCATAIDLSGGEERFRTDIPGQSSNQALVADSSGSLVNISTSTPILSRRQLGANQNALRQLEQEIDQAMRGDNVDSEREFGPRSSSPVVELGAGSGTRQPRPIIKTTTEMVLSAIPMANTAHPDELSSCVWICSTQHSRSKITVIDIETKPNELMDSFYVPTFLYCIKSICGAKPSDLLGISAGVIDELENSGESAQQTAASSDRAGTSTTNANTKPSSSLINMLEELISSQRREFYKLVQVDVGAQDRLRRSRMEARKSMSRPPSAMSSEQNAQEATEEQSDQMAHLDGRDSDEVAQNASGSRGNKSQNEQDSAEISRILENDASLGVATLQKLNDFVAHIQPGETDSPALEADRSSPSPPRQQTAETDVPNGEQNKQEVIYGQPFSTRLPTVWMGGKDSVLYIHSAIGQWKDCVACIKLADSILQICYFRGRVFVALADGTLCVFFRNANSKQWDFSTYFAIDINLMSEVTNDLASDLVGQTFRESRQSRNTDNVNDQSTETLAEVTAAADLTDGHPLSRNTSVLASPTRPRAKVAGIRCLEIANKNLWIGYRNRILILDPVSLKLKHTFSVVPQMDNQIRQVISMKDGVFCCLRSDLILRLYSSLRPYQHIQNIDIEPVVGRLISPKTFVISHITAMKVADNTLWIGNAHGIILTIPCKLVPQVSETTGVNRPTGTELEDSTGGLSIARFVPNCDIANSQISFHGHKDAVKFFVMAHNLMLSGGQGYLDFRLDMDDQCKSTSDKSHLILWQLPKQQSI